ncbi:MAG: hypothetical protein KFB96_10955 [Thiocapsa sp.]|uniref:hypothetical protein n=1 Tax=Thiocapsa sp. TaxID=2024551 RepID=UPI001BCCFEF0|nr:hypothetical protein [Thiocapsa sp.]QVL50871.1 MAG: hypothetical protein KFB96_10955 [Thiocapsa sp.]
MPTPTAGFLCLAVLLACGSSSAEGLLPRLLGDGCFGAYAGAIGDRPITLLIRQGRWPDAPTAWYGLDDTGQYDAVTNRFGFPARHIEDDGSQGDQVRLLERGDETGTIIGRFTGQLDAEGRIAGEWRAEVGGLVWPFSLQPLPVLRQGSAPAFSIHIREAVLEIAGEERVAITGVEGLLTDLYTECGPDPFSLSVRRLSGPPDLYVIAMEGHDAPGFTDPRDWVFRRPGAVQDPLYVASQVVVCSTTVGLGCYCTDNALRYAYAGGVLTIVDEEDETSEIEPERYGSCGCVQVDRTLKVLRVDVGTAAVWLDKLVELSGIKPAACHEDWQEPGPEEAKPIDDPPSPTFLDQAIPALQPYLFDDGMSGWLLVPADPRASVFRINQVPGDPALEIQPAKQTPDAQGPVSAEHYNGPDTPLKAACWLYNRTDTPGRFQQRTHPPAALADAFRLPRGPASDLALVGVEAIAETAFNDGDGASRTLGGLAVRWTENGTALVVRDEEAPLMLFDGERCYHRYLKEPGRWGMPWSEARYAELFGPAKAATVGD